MTRYPVIEKSSRVARWRDFAWFFLQKLISGK